MIRDSLKAMLERHEGRKNVPYNDTDTPPNLTIGVGWNMHANPLPDDIAMCLMHHGEITDAMVDKLLEISAAKAEEVCKRVYPGFDGFSLNRQDALIDMAFNMGEGNAKHGLKSLVNTNTDINAGRWASAAARLAKSAWAAEVKTRAQDVIKLIEEG